MRVEKKLVCPIGLSDKPIALTSYKKPLPLSDTAVGHAPP